MSLGFNLFATECHRSGPSRHQSSAKHWNPVRRRSCRTNIPGRRTFSTCGIDHFGQPTDSRDSHGGRSHRGGAVVARHPCYGACQRGLESKRHPCFCRVCDRSRSILCKRVSFVCPCFRRCKLLSLTMHFSRIPIVSMSVAKPERILSHCWMDALWIRANSLYLTNNWSFRTNTSLLRTMFTLTTLRALAHWLQKRC